MIAEKLIDYVTDFFYNYYIQRFRDLNLFDLLDIVMFLNGKALSRAEQIGNHLLEHIRYLFRALSYRYRYRYIHHTPKLALELWQESFDNLEQSIYLGIHCRSIDQVKILENVLDRSCSLSPMAELREALRVELEADLHCLQLSFGLHGISLSTITDFCLDRGSAMEAYLSCQEEWEKANETSSRIPIHSSGEAERLVQDKRCGESLPDRVIRKNFV